MSAIPQFTDELVRSGRTVEVVATATLEGSSIFDLWWKSGSTTGGAARSVSPTCRPTAASASGSAGRRPRSSKTVGLAAARPRTRRGVLESVLMWVLGQ